MTTAELNAASVADASRLLRQCCGSTRWVARMVGMRPFASAQAMHDRARSVWRSLDRDDVMEAISHHPRIGDRAQGAEAVEQAGAASADDDVKAALADGNRAYEERFDHIYLVCATGKSGPELLAILRARLQNDPDIEWRVAASEQENITALRLDKLVRRDA